LAKLFLFFLLVVVAVGAWLWNAIERPYQGFAANGVFVDVPHGTSSRAVARLLERKGVVRSSIAFEIYARRHPRRSLQAGEYFFDHAIAAHDVFWKLANGEVYEQPFTVREGETMFDIAHELEGAKFMSAEEFLKAASDATLIHDVAPRAATLEGFLFPATYHLPRSPVATELTAEMVRKFKEEWAGITGPETAADKAMAADGRPVSSVVTLASLVERETPKPEERPLVAGVFENRLRKDIALQCDPTVIYALERSKKYRGTLTLTDLRFDSPYNTYVHTGLPPGPIGNPGEMSLRAALHPAQTDYFYFVANTQGGHFFSSTLAEHNNNVLKYRRLLGGAAAAAPDPAINEKKPQPHDGRNGHKSHKGATR